MKSILIVTMFILLSAPLIAQNEELETDDTIGISGYISPFFETTSMVKQCNFMGGMGGIFLSSNFIIGGFGKTMTTYFKVDSAYNNKDKEMERNLELDLGGGGLVFGYILMPAKKIHPCIMFWVGGGSISLSDKNKIRIKDLYDDFLLLNGTLEIDYRPLKILSIGVGVHYQMVSGFNLYGYSNKDFNGGGFFVNLKVGSF